MIFYHADHTTTGVHPEFDKAIREVTAEFLSQEVDIIGKRKKDKIILRLFIPDVLEHIVTIDVIGYNKTSGHATGILATLPLAGPHKPHLLKEMVDAVTAVDKYVYLKNAPIFKMKKKRQ